MGGAALPSSVKYDCCFILRCQVWKCKERLWTLLLWRYSKLIWTPTCVTSCREPALAGALCSMVYWGSFQPLQFYVILWNAGFPGQNQFGVCTAFTVILLCHEFEVVSFFPGKSKTKENRQSIINPDWNFEKMGIGGLDKEFSDIFRRAFASRVFPPEIVEQMGK